MGKLIIVSKDKKEYKMDIFLNNQKICSLNPGDKNYFEINVENNYSIYCFSKHSQNKTQVEIIDLSKNILVEVAQGFINPKINISYLKSEELKKFDGNIFANVIIDKNKEYFKPSKAEEKRKESFLSIVGRVIIALIFFYIGFNLLFGGNGNSNSTTNYPYTIENQGIDEFGLYVISGKVTNNTNKDADGLKIEFKCYDEYNNHLDTVSDYTENLSSGSVWSYEINVVQNSDKISICEFYQITPFVKIGEFH